MGGGGEPKSPSFEKMVVLPTKAYQNLIVKAEQSKSSDVGGGHQGVHQESPAQANVTHIDVQEGATLQLEGGRGGPFFPPSQAGSYASTGFKGQRGTPKSLPPSSSAAAAGDKGKKGKSERQPMSRASAGKNKGPREAALAKSVFARGQPISQTTVKGDAFKDDLGGLRKKQEFVADRLARLRGKKRTGDKLPFLEAKRTKQESLTLPDADADMTDVSSVFPLPENASESAAADSLQQHDISMDEEERAVPRAPLQSDIESEEARVKHEESLTADDNLAQNIGEEILQSLPLQYQPDVPPPSKKVTALRKPAPWEKEVAKSVHGKRGKKRALAAFDAVENEIKKAVKERNLLPTPSGKVRSRGPPQEPLSQPIVSFPNEMDEGGEVQRGPQRKRPAQSPIDQSGKKGRRSAVKRGADGGDQFALEGPKRKAISAEERPALSYERRVPVKKRKELTWDGTRLARKRKGDGDDDQEWDEWTDAKKQRMNRGEKRKYPSSKLIYPSSKKRWWDWEGEEARGSGKKSDQIPVKSKRPTNPHRHSHHYWQADDHLIPDYFPMW